MPFPRRLPGTGEPAYEPPDRAMLDVAVRWLARIDPGRLRDRVAALPGPRNRSDAPVAMRATDRLLERSWRAAGWRIGRQRVQPGGLNIVAVREGREAPNEAIVVVAHHDTVPGSPGADDNGAGLAVLLELAEQLGGERHRRTLILAAPDYEEIGLVGSRPLARWLRATYQVRAAIVFDPIGFMDPRPGAQQVPAGIGMLYPDQLARLDRRERRGDTVVAIYRRRSLDVARAWATSLAATLDPDRIILLRDPLDLPVVGPMLMAVPLARHFSRSDHVRLWQAGLPAIQVTNTANFRNPNYHRPTDTPDTLDYETLRRVVAATAMTVERLAAVDPVSHD
ncbi:MAG: M28 family peptidase [Chloroflexi bacterium]|nr:M28 family peptidase [Chloroflexota bacterium]